MHCTDDVRVHVLHIHSFDHEHIQSTSLKAIDIRPKLSNADDGYKSFKRKMKKKIKCATNRTNTMCRCVAVSHLIRTECDNYRTVDAHGDHE